jgi:hypothetical protein
VRFLEHVRKHDKVWVATGKQIAEHWGRVHPAPDRVPGTSIA